LICSRIKDLLPEADIRTYYDPPPIPIRGCDWCAIDYSTYGGDEGDPIGFGETEQEAVAELVERLLELKDGD